MSGDVEGEPGEVSGRLFLSVGFLVVLLVLLVVAAVAWLVARNDDDSRGSEPCVGRRYDRETNVAITEDLIAFARGVAVGGGEEIQAIAETVNQAQEPWESSTTTVHECGPDLDVAKDYLFTIHYLVAHPETASPELVTALQEAAGPPEPGYPPSGIGGIYNFLYDGTLHEPDYPGLAELREARRLADHEADRDAVPEELQDRP